LKGYHDRGIWAKLELLQPGWSREKEGPSSRVFPSQGQQM